MVEQCEMVRWNTGTIWCISGTVWWTSVEQHSGIVEERGTVWWNSVERYGGTVEQCGGTLWNGMV